ncbi:DUF58 domain-containing protein [Hufsiella ginkgonis]|uniref:DUF58 domain-containing protein n=1 Tax=Hufsiella ginkgonis TaxID=2695274 RepID=A0A7K1Y1M6_9SPHI|nr:DUF58 domain-containing protein [Hufsiella ginkgonis]MXV17153.1 DUF58 domain-containing protein [Hufsiella ginkgonis]
MTQELSTYKELQDFGNLELLAQQVVEGFITGLHKSPFHGFSVEFAEHRLYNNGDSIRNIDWKLFARTDRLFVKRFEEETNLRCQLVLDVSSSMYYPGKEMNKLLFSVYSAASLMYLFKKQRDAFGLSCFSDHVELSTPAKSTAVHQKYLFAELERLLARESRGTKTSVASALHEIAEQVHKRSLIIIFSDMLETAGSKSELAEIFEALQHLKYNKHEVVIFNVLEHRSELDFAFDNRPYHFIDLESGDELKVNPSQVKASYLEAIRGFHKELQLKCAQYRIDFVDADMNAGFYQVLKAYLIKREKMN